MNELPKRKQNRLKDYDYSQIGAYFITICVKDRQEILGEIIVGDAAIGVPFATNIPFVRLTETGEMVKLHIERVGNITENVLLDKYIIMPNHIHMIISITNETAATNGTPRAASPTKAVIPKIVNALKSLTSKKFGESMWQRSYHDRVIRNENEYQKIWEYIDTNPSKWETDTYFVKKR